jgi:integrase
MPHYKGIYKRKNKKGSYSWYAYVEADKKQKYVPGSYPTAKKAYEAREIYLKKIQSGLPPEKENITVYRYAEDFLNRFKKRWRKGTFVNKESFLRTHIVPVLGDKTKLRSVTIDDIERIADGLYGKGLSSRYICEVLRFTKFFFETAVHTEYLDRNPAFTIKLPVLQKKPKPRIKPIRIIQMINTTESIRDKAIMALCFYGLLRIGEALPLQWTDIDFHESSIMINRRVYRKEIGDPKTPASKDTIYMIYPLDMILKEMKLQSTSDKWLFPSDRYPARPINYEAWYRDRFTPVCRAHNLNIGTHDLRRLGGQFLRELGVPIDFIQRQMRHAIISTTADIYTGVTEKMLIDRLKEIRKELVHIIEPNYEVKEDF